MDALKRTISKGGGALSEYESKKILKEYGFPVTNERLATTPDEAVEFARQIGFPVALKGCGSELTHKSETGAVELNVSSEQEALDAYERIVSAAPGLLDGVLTQEMIKGNRELVLGLHRDPQFGACVMLGLGGVFTEVLDDTVFRVAPIHNLEARDMIAQLRSKAILGNFRGQAPADVAEVCRCLEILGRIGLEHEEIGEIDVNPLIIDKQGRLAAVDALIVVRA